MDINKGGAPIKTFLATILTQYFEKEGVGDKNNIEKNFWNGILDQKVQFYIL